MGLSDEDKQFNELAFGYQPNGDLCIVAIVVFIVLAIVTSIQNVRTKSWYMFIVTGTALTEMGGYVARLYLAEISATRNAFIAMDVLLILSPNALALVNYLTVGMVVERAISRGVAEKKGLMACINPKFISVIFTTSDFLAFSIQGAAAGLLTTGQPQKVDLGRKVIMFGLGIQMFFFSVFSFITIYVHTSPSFHLRHNRMVRPIFLGLYATIILLTFRSIYRFTQFARNHSYVATHEWFFYVFDSVVVSGCMVAYICAPFGKYMDFDVEEKDIKLKPAEAEVAP